ncbi:hypothetical protein ACH5RR_015205 [Cinchona calisaya]|uniref:RNase H type-1 domain-containing protein n=1 Tax=Cinchona calisaya TaxID=153742 RepID=A0ABD2ZU87_9GENT
MDFWLLWMDRYFYYAEFWSIRFGLQIAKEKGLNKLILESDSKVVIDLLNNNCEIPPHVRALIADYRSYCLGIQGRFQHSYREGNFCADILANIGVKSSTPFNLRSQPPIGLGSLLVVDIRGFNWKRPS